MKESYVYSDGKIIVADKKENTIDLIKHEYQDNIEEIFKIENLLEVLKERKIKIENDLKYNLDNGEGFSLKSKIIGALAFFLILNLVSIPAMILGTMPILNAILYGVIGSTFALTFVSACAVLLGKLNSKEYNGLKLELQAINEKEEELNAVLNQLKKDKTAANLEAPKRLEQAKEVNYKRQLNELREYLLLFYQIGYNEKKYEKYFKEGILDAKALDCNLEKEDVEIVKTYFKTKKK